MSMQHAGQSAFDEWIERISARESVDLGDAAQRTLRAERDRAISARPYRRQAG